MISYVLGHTAMRAKSWSTLAEATVLLTHQSGPAEEGTHTLGSMWQPDLRGSGGPGKQALLLNLELSTAHGMCLYVLS